jgi:hypothetical protein
MNNANLKRSLTAAFVVLALSSGVSYAKGSVTATAYLNPSAPQDCNFVETQDTQKGCKHPACNTAVKNAIKKLQDAQPNGTCKAQAKSRGCEYNDCK